MPFSSFSFKRPLNSYAKIQALLGVLTRGNRLFVNRSRTRDLVLLNVGCGPILNKDFINLDYGWFPSLDVCWDIVKKRYPFPDGSMEGIYTEHCLEHISYESCIENLKEFHRLIKPGGTLRIIVPDAQIYFDLYQARKTDKSVKLPYSDGEETPDISINRIFRSHGHLFIYDFETLQLNLQKVGFKDIRKESLRKGRDSRLLVDRESRAVESLYVEATK
jgi:predicted SAM-dependent methyltransferase